MWNTLRKSLPLALMMMSLSMSAEARPHGDGDGMPLLRPGVVERISQELKLDAATTKKLQDIAYQAQVAQTRAQAEIKIQRMELKRQLDLDKPDEKEVMRQVDALNKLELDLRKQKISTMLQMRGLLTAEQRVQLKAMQQERMKERREHGGMGRGGARGMGGSHGGGPGMRGMGGGGNMPADPDDGDDL